MEWRHFQALGVGLLDAQNRQIGFGGEPLAHLVRIDATGLDPRLKDCSVVVACDVDNPLTGPRGASSVFGPQKGATPEMVARLDENLAHHARLIHRDLGVDVARVPGSGAAGGMGAALLAFLGASLRPGVEIVIEAVGLEAAMLDADLVITGEGLMDGQTICGKAPAGVARVAKRHGKPVIGLAGGLAPDVGVVHAHGIDAVFSALLHACSLEEAMGNAAMNIRMTSRNIAATIKLARSLRPEKP